MPLDDLEFSDERIEEVFEGETPRWKKGGYAYSNAAKRFYGKIKALRDRGFSFIQICGGFEKLGLLAPGSKPYSLRQAFFREIARRNRTNELLREIRDGPSVEERVMEASTPKKAPGVAESLKIPRAPNTTAGSEKADSAAQAMEIRRNPGADGLGHESRPASDAEEKERVKNILGLKAVDMGTGEITKNPDGTFDYD